MAHSRARVNLPERIDYETLISRAQAAGLNVDAKKVDVPVARQYQVTMHGPHGDDLTLPDLWEDLADVEVVQLIEADDDGR